MNGHRRTVQLKPIDAARKSLGALASGDDFEKTLGLLLDLVGIAGKDLPKNATAPGGGAQ